MSRPIGKAVMTHVNVNVNVNVNVHVNVNKNVHVNQTESPLEMALTKSSNMLIISHHSRETFEATETFQAFETSRPRPNR